MFFFSCISSGDLKLISKTDWYFCHKFKSHVFRGLSQFSSDQLMYTYSSPNPTFCLICYQLTAVGLGDGWVHICTDIDINTRFFS